MDPFLSLAEAVRFELTEELPLRRFSRPVHSTALPRFLRTKDEPPKKQGHTGFYQGIALGQTAPSLANSLLSSAFSELSLSRHGI